MIKNAAINILLRTNAFSVFRNANKAKTPILMYHRFSEGEEYGKTSRQTFETHLKYLTKNYKIVSLTHAVMHGTDNRTAVLTVDDGYCDFYDVAFPVLKKFGVTATLYAVTGFVSKRCWIWTDKARHILGRTRLEKFQFQIGRKEFDEELGNADSRLDLAGRVNSELKKLSDDEKELVLGELATKLEVNLDELPPAEFGPTNWDQLREMAKAGIEIGSHTVNHPILTNVAADVLADELTSSKLELENILQTPTIHFCYPNGNVSGRERDAAEKVGYTSAVTTEIRLRDRSDDHFLLPRIDAEPEIERLIQSTSGFDAFKAKYR